MVTAAAMMTANRRPPPRSARRGAGCDSSEGRLTPPSLRGTLLDRALRADAAVGQKDASRPFVRQFESAVTQGIGQGFGLFGEARADGHVEARVPAADGSFQC
jgi:hypothetical protein